MGKKNQRFSQWLYQFIRLSKFRLSQVEIVQKVVSIPRYSVFRLWQPWGISDRNVKRKCGDILQKTFEINIWNRKSKQHNKKIFLLKGDDREGNEMFSDFYVNLNNVGYRLRCSDNMYFLQKRNGSCLKRDWFSYGPLICPVRVIGRFNSYLMLELVIQGLFVMTTYYVS